MKWDYRIYDSIYDLIIVGGGPSGYTASMYSSRAGLKTLQFEGFYFGGQLMRTEKIDNFPSYFDGIDGKELMVSMRKHAEISGAEIKQEDIVKVDFSGKIKKLFTVDKEFKSRAVIIATGSKPKMVGIKNEDLFFNKGISTCAVCDGPLPHNRNQQIAIIGGGDTACTEVLFLSKFASKIFLIVRNCRLKASKFLKDKILSLPNLEILFEVNVTEAFGNESGMLGGICLKGNGSSENRRLFVSSLFYAIGSEPQVSFLNGSGIQINKSGYIITGPKSTETNLEGVFACGDVQDSKYRQAITSAGTGAMAYTDAYEYIFKGCSF